MRRVILVLVTVLLATALPGPVLAQAGKAGKPGKDRQVLTGKLLKSLRRGDSTQVRALVAQGAPIDGDAFMVALGNNRPDMARLLVRLGGDPDANGSMGMPALALFLSDKDTDKLTLLLELGANPNQRVGKGQVTPLMMAAIENQVEAAKVLLQAGADPSMKSGDGETAMEWAVAVGALSGDKKMAETLADGSPESQALLSKITGDMNVDGTHQDGAQTLSEDQSTYVQGKFTGPCLARRNPRFDPAKPKPGMSGSGGYRETHVSFKGGQKVGMITPPDCTPLDLMPAQYEITVLGGDLSWVWECEKGRGGKCPILVRSENYESANNRFDVGVERGPPNDAAAGPDEPCRVESVEITSPSPGKQVSFDGSPTGFLKVTARAVAKPDDCDKPLQWSMADIGSSKALVQAAGDTAVFTYRGLPDRNDDFGPTVIKVSAGGKTDTASVVVFFTPVAFNHGGSGSLPNWMYYWDQTRAGSGETPSYTPERISETVEGERVQGQYDYAEDVVYLTDRAYGSSCARRNAAYGGGSSKGIDCFAELVRHEGQHKKERHQWWGTFNPKAAKAAGLASYMKNYDADADLVPNDVEKRLSESRGCNWLWPKSCSGRPDGTIDLEMNAYGEGWSWIRGGADAQDWSWCGKQWQDAKVCPGGKIW